MTLEDIGKILSGYGRPSDTLTDNDWQTAFHLIKLNTTPSGDKYFSTRSATYNENIVSLVGQPETQIHRYKSYINDVLRQIRKGKRDYCYYINQIVDLLRFEPVKLKTKYYKKDKYFEVWLED